MTVTVWVAQSLTLQLLVAVSSLGFGVMALRVAPRPGTSARTAAWFLAGVTFWSEGVLATVHSILAVATALAGPGTGLWTAYMRATLAGNVARNMVVLGFALALAWVVLLGRRSLSRRVIVTTAAALMLAGAVIGLFEPAVQAQSDSGRFGVVSYLGAVTAVLLIAVLFRAMVAENVDWLLWVALALYAVQEVLVSLIPMVLSWTGSGWVWSPPSGAMRWTGLIAAIAMLVCSACAQASRVVSLEPPRLRHSPGHRLLAWASFLFSRRDVDEVIEPAITDMRIEYNDALLAGHRAHARWIRVRGTYGILATAALLIAARSGRVFVTVWRLIGKG